MTLFTKKVYQQLTEEAIAILLKTKENIKDDSDCMWTSYENGIEIRNEIDRCIAGLKSGDKTILKEAYAHFLPTSTFQEHSMQNGWTTTYLRLSGEFDKVYELLSKGS